MSTFTMIFLGVGSVAILLLLNWVFSLRRVVPTDAVDIVQRAGSTQSYGNAEQSINGNVYYRWPSWIPHYGVLTRTLPLSIIELELNDYEAYDEDRLPFNVDIKAFFRIEDSNTAASRVTNMESLKQQLLSIVEGSVRSIMATSNLEEIMSKRGKYGTLFTAEVTEDLKEWGVITTKSIELMDVRDAEGSQVITNIMAKKQSEIEKDSRLVVAKNAQEAQTGEIQAQKTVDVSAENARKEVGMRTAEVNKEVGVAEEHAKQEIKEQARTTMEKDMAVAKVQQVRSAEIQRDAGLVNAEEVKQVAVINAEGIKQSTVIKAEGDLTAKQAEAKGIEAEGKAEAEADKAKQLASVTAETTLAEKVGANANYQDYMVRIATVKANETVGVANAEALVGADVKVIANTGDAGDGIKSVAELFTPKGGTQLAGMIEAVAQSEIGEELIDKVIGKKPVVTNKVSPRKIKVPTEMIDL